MPDWTEPTLFEDADLHDPLAEAVAALVTQFGYPAVLYEVERHAWPPRAVPSAPARRSDPETSHLAAKREADVGRFSDRSRSAKLLRCFAHDDLTDQQATTRIVGAQAAISAFEGCRRRCSDLRAARYLYDTGKRRKNTGSDDEAIVWGISDAGREALTRLGETGWSR